MVEGTCAVWTIEEMDMPTLKEWQEACAVIDSAITKERARCLEIVEKVLAADSDLIADRIPRECEVASESRLIELVWQSAAKECLKQIKGDSNG